MADNKSDSLDYSTFAARMQSPSLSARGGGRISKKWRLGSAGV